MPSPIEFVAHPREYRAINACDGYVHKFRFEAHHESAREVAASPNPLSAPSTPTVSLGWLLGKLALSMLVLGGLAVAGARILS